MIIINCEQGTDEWWTAKLGIPSASNFNKILTPGTLKPSQSKTEYINKLLAELLRGKPDDSFQSDWMKRGHEVEQEARDYYAFSQNVEPAQVGFCLTDDKKVGASPDALINDDGGFETKCPSPGVHTGYLLANKLPTIYKLQVVGGILVTGRQWWDFLSYHPDLPPFLVRTHRKDVQKELGLLSAALIDFVKQFESAKQQLISQGYMETI